mgnify:FL=1
MKQRYFPGKYLYRNGREREKQRTEQPNKLKLGGVGSGQGAWKEYESEKGEREIDGTWN